MSNRDFLIIKCENPEVISSCIINGEVKLPDTKFWYDTELYKDDFRECQLSAPRVPEDGVIALSKKYPQDIIKCQYSFEHENYFKTYNVEYLNGISSHTSIDIGYDYLGDYIDVGDEVIKKVEAFFKKIDTIENLGDGNYDIKLCEDKVSVTFNIDDETKIKATKQGHLIKIKIFKREIVKVKWISQSHKINENDELPF